MAKLKCNLCDSKMRYIEFNGTHIWVCDDCPNVQFEYYTIKDIENLIKYLIK